MIACYHLSVAWSSDQRPLFHDLSFEIPSNSWVQCIGPANSGKSVLFALLSLRCAPKKGQLIVGGRNLTRLRRFKLAKLRQRMGTCAQGPELLMDRTVRENMLLPFLARQDLEGAPKQVETLLESLHLTHLGDVRVEVLSAQEQRVVAIARAMVGSPELILIDGGLEGIEDGQQRRILTALRQAHRHGSTIMMFSRKAIKLMGIESIEMRLDRGQMRLVERLHQSPTPDHQDFKATRRR